MVMSAVQGRTPGVDTLISITKTDGESLAATLDAHRLAGHRGGHLHVLFKCDIVGFMETINSLVDCEATTIEWFDCRELGLIDGLIHWSRTCNRRKLPTYVQVVAEDDRWTSSPIDPRTLHAPMHLAPIAYSYAMGSVHEEPSESLVGLEPPRYRSLAGGQVVAGDTGWHSVIDSDVFFAYLDFLSDMPAYLPFMSNACVWLAACRGDIARAPNFFFVKECYGRMLEDNTEAAVTSMIRQGFCAEDYELQTFAYYAVASLLVLEEFRRIPNHRSAILLVLAANLALFWRISKAADKTVGRRLWNGVGHSRALAASHAILRLAGTERTVWLMRKYLPRRLNAARERASPELNALLEHVEARLSKASAP